MKKSTLVLVAGIILITCAGQAAASAVEKSEGSTIDQLLSGTLKPKEVTVDPANSRRYAGVYELAPNFLLTVTLEDGKLMTQATGQSKVQVFPESETKFFLKVTYAQIEFLKDEAGNVNSLKLYQGGQIVPVTKVK